MSNNVPHNNPTEKRLNARAALGGGSQKNEGVEKGGQWDAGEEEKRERAKRALEGKQQEESEKDEGWGAKEEEKRAQAKRALESEEEKREREKKERIKKGEEERIKMEREEAVRREKEKAVRKVEEVRKAEMEEEEKRKEEEKEKKWNEEKKRRKKEEGETLRKTLLEKIQKRRGRIDSTNEKEIRTEPTKKEVERRTPQKMPKKERIQEIPSLRTFSGDVVKAIKKQKGSIAKIAIAEQKRKRRRKKEGGTKKRGNRKMAVWITVGLLAVSVSGIALFYQFKGGAKTSEKVRLPAVVQKAIIPPEREAGIDAETPVAEIRSAIIREIEETVERGGIKNIYLTAQFSIQTPEGVVRERKLAGVDKLLSIWDHRMPDELERSFSGEFMLGVYSDPPLANSPFLILTTTLYEQTFAGMLKWEEDMKDDLYGLFGLDKAGAVGIVFLDMIIGGEDVRVLKGVNNEVILLYSFINKNTVVVTLNEETFSEVLRGLSSTLPDLR